MHVLQQVSCPADRGDKPYRGTVMAIGPLTSHMGKPFRWITVRRNDTLTKHVWPSHRLITE